MSTKYCPSCKKEKPVSGFWKDKFTRDGLKRLCSPCQSAYNKGMTLDQYRKHLELKNEVLPPATKTKDNVVRFSESYINNKKKVADYRVKANKISDGKLKDDFTNHFFSHFGFFDTAPDQEGLHRKPDPSAYGGRINESSSFSSGLNG